MSDWYDNIYRHATDPRNVIERVKEILGDWYDVRAMYYPEILTNVYHIHNSSSGVTIRVDITDEIANELGLLIPDFIATRVRVETLKQEVDEPLYPPPSKPTHLVLYFKSKEERMSEIFTMPLLVAAKAQNILGDDYKVMYTHNHTNHVTLYDVWNVITGKAVKIIINDADDWFLGSATPRYIAREAKRRLSNE